MAASSDSEANLHDQSSRSIRLKHQSSIYRSLNLICKELQAEADGGSKPWIHTTQADIFFSGVIILNAIEIAVEVEIRPAKGIGLFWGVEFCFLLIFGLELVLRGRAVGFARHCTTLWGFFDYVVVLSGVIDTWIITPFISTSGERSLSIVAVLRIFRLVRLVRVVKIFRFLQELQLLLSAVTQSLRAVFWMMFLLAGVIYVGGVLCAVVVGSDLRHDDTTEDLSADEEENQKNFGSLGASIFTHFSLITTDKWVHVTEAVVHRFGWGWVFYFSFYILLTNFCLLNMVISVITEKVASVDMNLVSEEQLVAEREAFRICMSEVFNAMHLELDQPEGYETYASLFAHPETRKILEAFQISAAMPFTQFWPIIDWYGSGNVTPSEFLTSCFRLYGSRGKRNFQLLAWQGDLHKGSQVIKNEFASVGNSIELKADNTSKSLQELQQACSVLHEQLHAISRLKSSSEDQDEYDLPPIVEPEDIPMQFPGVDKVSKLLEADERGRYRNSVSGIFKIEPVENPYDARLSRRCCVEENCATSCGCSSVRF